MSGTLCDKIARIANDAIGYECTHTGSPDDSVPGGCPDCWRVSLAVADVLAPPVQQAKAAAWEAGWTAGVDDQAHWDGWRWAKGHPTPNPHKDPE